MWVEGASYAATPRATWLREQLLFAKAHQTWSPWGAFNQCIVAQGHSSLPFLHLPRPPNPRCMPSASPASPVDPLQYIQAVIISQPCLHHSLLFLPFPLLDTPILSPPRSDQTFACSLLSVLSLQSCPTLCHPMDCSPPGSSVHGILQARILEWIAVPFSRGSSRPRD